MILEIAAHTGGGWRENHCPGRRLRYAVHSVRLFLLAQPVLLAHLLATGGHPGLHPPRRKYEVLPHERTNSELREDAATPSTSGLTLADGGQLTAQFVVYAIGGPSQGALPRLAVLKKLKGSMFYSADWNHDVDFSGKRVAVTGSGASAIRFVPRPSPGAASSCCSRATPSWLIMRPRRA